MITCPALHHSSSPSNPSSPPPPAIITPNDDFFDYGSALNDIATAVEQMNQCWLSTIATTNPRLNMSACLEPCHSSSLYLPTTCSPQITTTTLAATRSHVANYPDPIATSRFLEPSQHGMATSGENVLDPSLLAAIQSLNNFLLQYPRPSIPPMPMPATSLPIAASCRSATMIS